MTAGIFSLKLHPKAKWPFGAFVIVVLVIWGEIFQIDIARHSLVKENDIREVGHLADFSETHLTRIFDNVDEYIRALRYQYTHQQSTDSITNFISEIPPDSSIISYVGVVDKEGVPHIITDHDLPKTLTMENRELFRHFLDDPTDHIYVSKPYMSKITGVVKFNFARPILDQDGVFSGVIFAAFEQSAFAFVLESMNFTRNFDARAVGLDGITRASRGRTSQSNDQETKWPAADQYKKLENEYSSLQIDNNVFTSRIIGPYPLRIEISYPTDTDLEGLSEFHILLTSIAALVTVGSVVFLTLYNRTLFARDALAQSETRFQDFATSSSDWLWEMDADLRFNYMSDQDYEISGFPASTFIGKRRSDLAPTNENWAEHIKTLERHEPFKQFVYSTVSNYGNEIWVSVSGVPIFDDTGEFQGYRGTGTDITSVIKTEEQLRETKENLEIIVEQRTADLVHEIQDRQKIEQELRKGEDQLRDFGAAAADWYWETDENGNFSFLSDEFEIITGIDPATRIGKKRGVDGFVSVTHEDVESHLDDLANHRPFRNFVRLLIIPRDGSEMWVSANGKPTFDSDGNFKGYRGTGIDITEQRKDQLRLQSLLSALEQMPEAVVVLDPDDNFMFTNQAYRQYNRDKIDLIQIGQPYRKLIEAHAYNGLVPSAIGREEEYLKERMEQHQHPSGIHESESRPGVWHQRTEYILPGGGRAVLIVDITNLKKTQQELIKARDEAETANKAKSNFLSSMSHELRTPLNAILGFSQTLARNPKEPLTDRQSESIQLISSSGEHLLQLISEVLDLSQIEAGKLELSAERVSTKAVVKDCVDIARMLAHEREVDIQNNIDEQIVPDLFTDGTRLRQIVLNLITNAVKYNRHGGTVTIDYNQIHDDVLRITVSDNGFGIDPKHHDRIFEPFDRLGKTSEDADGTGIGLALSRKIADALGGNIDFTSKFGEGSSFWIELPVARNKDNQTSSNTPKTCDPHPFLSSLPERKYSIVYIEDNRINIQLMRSIFSDFENVDLTVALDAPTGIRMINESKPDLILMDIGLPGLNGIDAVKILKTQQATSNIPVIAISAAAMPDDLNKARDAGFYDYLTKPLDISKTLSVIEAAITPKH